MVDATENTKKNYNHTKSWLADFLQSETRLIDITSDDLDRWLRHMRAEGLALSNRNKHIQGAKKFFQTAVDARLLSESPAVKLKEDRPPNGQKVDRSRQAFFDPELTAEVLEGPGKHDHDNAKADRTGCRQRQLPAQDVAAIAIHTSH